MITLNKYTRTFALAGVVVRVHLDYFPDDAINAYVVETSSVHGGGTWTFTLDRAVTSDEKSAREEFGIQCDALEKMTLDDIVKRAANILRGSR